MNQSNGEQVEGFVRSRHQSYSFLHTPNQPPSGKSVLITGASKGIGRAIAIRFAAAGYSRIALAARSPLDAIEVEVRDAAIRANRPTPQVLSLTMDVASPADVQAGVATFTETFGDSLDVLVTNAGIMEPWRPIAEANPTEWWRTWEVNLKGTFNCAHYFIPLLLKSSTKTLVTVSSVGSYKLGVGASAYNASRLATCRLNEFIDHEYSGQGLISVSIHPGDVKTDLSSKLPEFLHPKLLDEPELAADTIVWLASERREWLSGRYISCNWDMEALEGRKSEIMTKDLFKFVMAV
ncbi:NAD(P)-binding protein [Thozetella sp. PMI_491]|nr:NAD(P)-binding protein [Thozetella sp. PMI_491]